MSNKIPRRKLIQAAGALAAAGAVPGLLATGIVPRPHEETGRVQAQSKRLRQWAMVIDLRKCEGCVTTEKPPQCAEACNAEHFVPDGQQWLRVFKVDRHDGGSYFMPRPCMNCENAPCLNVCPVGATFRNPEGVILVNHERCIGCRLCMAGCPYGARSFNWDEPKNPPGATFASYTPEYPVPHRRGTVEKCMLCAHRTRDGKIPACADSCPMYAIYLGDLVEDVATNGKEVVTLSRLLAENQAFRLKEELGTKPRVWYIPGHGQDYGRNFDDHRDAMEARSWQEQELTTEGEHDSQ